MGVNIIDRIQAKIELFRLEQRYTRRRNRRSTFVSNAIYVDGEYVYNTPNTTGSSTATGATTKTSNSSKLKNRWSSMPGFGSLSKANAPTIREHDWSSPRVSASEVR